MTTMTGATKEFELSQPPKGTISKVAFSPTDSDHLIASSWDQHVHLYDTDKNELLASFEQLGPVLDCCFADETTAFSGGLAKTLMRHDLSSGETNALGAHDDAIKCIRYCSETDQVVSGGWDAMVKVWDIRAQHTCVAEAEQPDKVYAMGIAANMIIVGTAGRHVYVWDIRNMSEVVQRRESSLKFQTRYIEASSSNDGYVISSVDGKACVEYLDVSAEAQAKKFAFKCHRQKEEGAEHIFPVNAIAFHPVYGTFATGGSDGIVSIWDRERRRAVYRSHEYAVGISSLAFNARGTKMAIATSYLNDEGEKDHAPDAVFVRKITDINVKPK